MARNKYPEETIQKILEVSAKLFIEKGYDKTSMQNIIDNLGGLSKGAIYHHYKSKENIFEAIFDKYEIESEILLSRIRDNPNLTGLEKLRQIFKNSITSSIADPLQYTIPNLLEHPKLLTIQIRDIISYVAPTFIEPVLWEGIADGSIKAENPKELATAILMLSAIWLNPFIESVDENGFRAKCNVFNQLLGGVGIDNLLDEDTINHAVGFNAKTK